MSAASLHSTTSSPAASRASVSFITRAHAALPAASFCASTHAAPTWRHAASALVQFGPRMGGASVRRGDARGAAGQTSAAGAGT